MVNGNQEYSLVNDVGTMREQTQGESLVNVSMDSERIEAEFL